MRRLMPQILTDPTNHSGTRSIDSGLAFFIRSFFKWWSLNYFYWSSMYTLSTERNKHSVDLPSCFIQSLTYLFGTRQVPKHLTAVGR